MSMSLRARVLKKTRAIIRRVWSILPPTRVGRSIVVLLFLVGIFLRVAGLAWGIPPRDNAPSYYHDEGHVLGFIERDWGAYWETFSWYELARPVFLYRLVGRPLIALGRAAGWDDPATRVAELVTLRSINAAFSIAGLVGIYLVGSKLGGPRTGAWALAFLTFVPGHWYYGQILKGDVLIATLFTFALLAAFVLAERGTWASYLWAGVLVGFGTSLKPTMLVAVPLLVIAHGLFTWRRRTFRAFLSPRALAAVAVALLTFFAFYPYPYKNPELFRKEGMVELFGPKSDLLTFKLVASPATYRDLWAAYTKVDRPFMDMVFGHFLRGVLIPSTVVVALAALYQLRRGSVRLLLAVLFGLLFFHSLTFAPPLDDRYVVPGAPFVVLFPALLASAASVFGSTHLLTRRAGALLGVALLVGTAGITWQTYPSFAFADPREQTVGWVHANAQPKALIGQPTLTGRWALLFDRSEVETTTLIQGEGERRHVTRLARPPLVVVQREPWHYDHTFRYELEGVHGQFAQLLSLYEHAETFGREPTLFGTLLPRNLGAPVIDVYRRSREPAERDTRPLLPHGGVDLPIQERSALVFSSRFASEELRNAAARVTVDFGGLTESWRSGGGRIRLGLAALWDGASLPETFGELPDDSTFVTKGNAWVWLTSVMPADVAAHEGLTVAFDHVAPEVWDVYDGFDGALRPRTLGTRSAGTVQFALVALGPKEGAGTVRVVDAAVFRPVF